MTYIRYFLEKRLKTIYRKAGKNKEIPYFVCLAVKGTDYENYNKTPGPKEEDIDIMHKYRDAKVYENKKKGRYEKRKI